MTEIANREIPGTLEVMGDPTGGRLVAWAQAASAANQLAKALTTTTFVPAAFKGNIGDATAAILMGDELGLSPLAALRSIYVVHGAPAMYARTMVALAQSHGHQIWTELSTDAKVVVCGQRRGSDKVERSEWTIARARTAGYTSNKQYGSNPQNMLYAKAAAEVARKVAADVLAGVPYSVEDIELDQPAPRTTVQRETTKVRRDPAPEPEPSGMDEFHPDTTSNLEPEPAGYLFDDSEPITAPQMRKMQAAYNELGFSDRDERLADAGAFLGRDLATSKDLTKNEATRLIDYLEMRVHGDDAPPEESP